jgi:hypothetical protein
MTDVEVVVDPTSHWLRGVAPARDLTVLWRSYCLEIRDDNDVAPTVPPGYRQQALEGHAIPHRMLRICEAARAVSGEDAVDRSYSQWGRSYFVSKRRRGTAPAECVAAAGLDSGLVEASDDERCDVPIREAMEVAYALGGPKTQTPAIAVRADPPHGSRAR